MPDILSVKLAARMSSWVLVKIEDDPSRRLLVARCLKCHEMVVAGTERKLVEKAVLHHHCKDILPKPGDPDYLTQRN